LGEQVTQVQLSLPSWEQVARSCPGGEAEGLRGVIVGRVVDDSSGLPLRDAAVLARWSDISLDSSGSVRAAASERLTRSDARGEYALCGVDTAAIITVQGFAGWAATAPVATLIGDRGYARRDLVIARDPVVVEDAEAVAGVVALRSDEVPGPGAVLSGVVRDPGGQLLRDASV